MPRDLFNLEGNPARQRAFAELRAEYGDQPFDVRLIDSRAKHYALPPLPVILPPLPVILPPLPEIR